MSINQCNLFKPGIQRLLMAMFVCSVVATVGCSQYRLQGTVVAGEESGVYVVSADDVRLQTMGIEQARIEFTLDPSSLNSINAGTALAGRDGKFEIAIDQIGAGFLQYELGVLCRKQSFQSTWETVSLPASKRRLLIVMSAGTDTYREKENILEQTLKMIPDEY